MTDSTLETSRLPAGDAADVKIRAMRVFEDYLVELERGAPPDPEELLARHLDLAEPLRAYLASMEFLRSAAAGLRGAPRLKEPLDAPIAESTQPLGDFRILREVGRGGMGIVYEAEQVSLGRRVALKVLPFAAVLDSKQLQRFKNEAQAAAQLHHTNIVPVHAVGCERGVHFYAMQFIDGRNLADVIRDLRQLNPVAPASQVAPASSRHVPPASSRHVAQASSRHAPDGASLPTRRQDGGGTGRQDAGATAGSSGAVGLPGSGHSTKDRAFFRAAAQLGVQAAEALAHAHELGVIHRDIKPSNLLLDLRGNLWITDFGLAQIQSDPGLTLTGDVLGTLRYMSPEQALAKRVGVDHRTDIYSLGVTLYELLTLEPVFAGRDRQELLRRIAFDEPRPPRRVNPALPHELDTILLKTIAKNPAERYATAHELADDLRRFLEDKPIRARRPTLAQRAGKWSRRHRTVVASALVILALAVVGLSFGTVLLWQEQARTKAAYAQATANEAQAKLEATKAQQEAAKADAVRDFLQDMLTAADPAKAKGEKLTVREALDTAAKRIDERPIKDQPLVEAEIRFTIGSTYIALGLFPQAEAQLRAADALQSRELGEDHPDTLRTRWKLAQALAWEGDYAGAAALAQPTLEARTRVLGPEHPDTLHSMVQLGRVLWAQVGRFAEAESLLRSAIERQQRVLGRNHEQTANAMDALAELYALNSYPEKAEPLAREALRIHTQELGEEHPRTLGSMSLLATALHNLGRPEEAVALNRRVVETNLRILGPEHMRTLMARGNLANSLNRLRRHSEAETMHRECLAALLRTAGPTHSNTITQKRYLAGCLADQRRYPEAETLLREALDAARETYGLEDADTSIKLMCALTRVLAAQRKDADAEQVARQVLEFQHRQLPRPDPGLFDDSSSALSQVLKRRGANDEALRIEQELIESWLAAVQAPDASASMLNGAARRLLYPASEKLRDAPRALELALQANERSGQQNPRHLRTLAQAYMLMGDSARATQVWEKAIALSPDEDSRAVMLNDAAWELLTATPDTIRDPAAALQFALRANEASDYRNPEYLDSLALAYFRTGETLKAIGFQKQALELLPQDAPQRPDYETRLAEFEAALEKASGKDGMP